MKPLAAPIPESALKQLFILCYFFLLLSLGALVFPSRIFKKVLYENSYVNVFTYVKSPSQQRDCLNLATLTGKDFQCF